MGLGRVDLGPAVSGEVHDRVAGAGHQQVGPGVGVQTRRYVVPGRPAGRRTTRRPPWRSWSVHTGTATWKTTQRSTSSLSRPRRGLLRLPKVQDLRDPATPADSRPVASGPGSRRPRSGRSRVGITRVGSRHELRGSAEHAPVPRLRFRGTLPAWTPETYAQQWRTSPCSNSSRPPWHAGMRFWTPCGTRTTRKGVVCRENRGAAEPLIAAGRSVRRSPVRQGDSSFSSTVFTVPTALPVPGSLPQRRQATSRFGRTAPSTPTTLGKPTRIRRPGR